MEIKRDFTQILRARIREKLNFLQVVLGPRQVGKTTGVRQVFKDWAGSKLWADADLPAPPESEWIMAHWNQARSLGGEVLLVFDEIQKIPRWSETIRGLFDRDRPSRRFRVVLLGSASLTLGAGLHESLAGRFEIIGVPHWNLKECREAFGWELSSFLRFGGYPAPAEMLPDTSRWQRFMRDAIIEPVIARDIFGLVQIRKPALFRQTLELALQYPAQSVSYQKLIGQLQEAGNVSTVQNYLQILEATFMLKLVPKFTGSAVREKSTSPKIVPLAPALLHVFKSAAEFETNPSWRGRIIEAAVGAALLGRYERVSYWSKQHAEIDFIVQDGEKLYAIEVKSGRPRKNYGTSQFLRERPEAIPVMISETELPVFLETGDLPALIGSQDFGD